MLHLPHARFIPRVDDASTAGQAALTVWRRSQMSFMSSSTEEHFLQETQAALKAFYGQPANATEFATQLVGLSPSIDRVAFVMRMQPVEQTLGALSARGNELLLRQSAKDMFVSPPVDTTTQQLLAQLVKEVKELRRSICPQDLVNGDDRTLGLPLPDPSDFLRETLAGHFVALHYEGDQRHMREVSTFVDHQNVVVARAVQPTRSGISTTPIVAAYCYFAGQSDDLAAHESQLVRALTPSLLARLDRKAVQQEIATRLGEDLQYLIGLAAWGMARQSFADAYAANAVEASFELATSPLIRGRELLEAARPSGVAMGI